VAVLSVAVVISPMFVGRDPKIEQFPKSIEDCESYGVAHYCILIVSEVWGQCKNVQWPTCKVINIYCRYEAYYGLRVSHFH